MTGHGFHTSEKLGTIADYLTPCPCITLFFIILGCIPLLKVLNLLATYVHWKLKAKKKLSDYGEWAVVTGATDGIGLAIALDIAKHRMKVCIVGRSQSKLDDAEKQLKEAKAREVMQLCVDFSASDDSAYARVTKALSGLDIGLLVNNVGMSYPHSQYLSELTSQFIDNLINVNVRSAMRMTHIVYPGMCQRKRGAIICVGSGSSIVPCDPLYCGYAGTKAAVESFCRSLQAECQKFNIFVQCHTPLLVTSKLSKCRTPSLTVLSTKQYAKLAIECIQKGSICGVVTTSPAFIHSLLLWAANTVPLICWKMLRMHEVLSIYKRALKKKQQQQEESKKNC